LERYADLGYQNFEGVARRADCSSCSDTCGVYLYPLWKEDSVLRGSRNADSPTRNAEGELIFVKPWEEQQPFSSFIDFISSQELHSSPFVPEVRYAQTRPYLLT
jgi:hypothetical protein